MDSEYQLKKACRATTRQSAGRALDACHQLPGQILVGHVCVDIRASIIASATLCPWSSEWLVVVDFQGEVLHPGSRT